MSKSALKNSSIPFVHLIGSALVVAALVFMTFASARFGYSRLLTRYALVTNSLVAANEAVRITPSDADAHRARGTVSMRLQLFDQAADEFSKATSLRPSDDYLWLERGLAQDETGDASAAYLSFDRAVQYAPFYAHTHWQRGNVLLRLGRYDEAFADLRAAAKSNRTFLPNAIDLAWSLSHEDASSTTQWLQLDSNYERVFYTRFLARKGKGPETLSQFQSSPSAFSDPQKRDLVRQLFDHHAFHEAFEIWKTSNAFTFDKLPAVYNGGFEENLAYDEAGFGWIVSRSFPHAEMSLDQAEHSSGKQSLKITFTGDSDPDLPVVSQTMLTQAATRYRLVFSVKTRDIVSGGLPYVSVRDAATGQEIGHSQSLDQKINEWQTMNFEFTSLPGSEAVTLVVQRSRCGSTPCPIFGNIWFDNISIEEVSGKS